MTNKSDNATDEEKLLEVVGKKHRKRNRERKKTKPTTKLH
jgi:hypothetical protein